MQRAFLNALYDLAQNDPNVLYLIADNGTGFEALFTREFPRQFFDFGISEEHMVAAAAGMASCGKIPFVYTASAFLAYHSCEFIRDDVCFQNQNVKLIGNGSGLSISTLGPTHHATEDISILRALPNLTLLSPASPAETQKAILAAYAIDGPVYVRIGMGGEKEIYPGDFDFYAGKNTSLRVGEDVAIFSTGSITEQAFNAAQILEKKGIQSSVLNVHTIKPLDQQSILDAAGKHDLIVSVEEHNIIGGLGGAIAEVLAESGATTRLLRVGLKDVFARGYGSLDQMRSTNGLDAESIADTIWTQYEYVGNI